MKRKLTTTAAAARKFLAFAEHVFLIAHGWVEMGEDSWEPPPAYPYRDKQRTTGHAVNSQKLANNDSRRGSLRDY